MNRCEWGPWQGDTTARDSWDKLLKSIRDRDLTKPGKLPVQMAQILPHHHHDAATSSQTQQQELRTAAPEGCSGLIHPTAPFRKSKLSRPWVKVKALPCYPKGRGISPWPTLVSSSTVRLKSPQEKMMPRRQRQEENHYFTTINPTYPSYSQHMWPVPEKHNLFISPD